MHDFVEKELLLLKKEYEKPQMSQAQFEELRAKMEEAKMADKKDKIKRIRTRAALTAAAFVGSFLLLPNTSPVIAHAMEQIPVLGKLIEVVTFRDYEYESDRNHADIEVPEIKVELGLPEDQTLENLERTTDEINREIKKITDSLIEEFETYLEEEEGYQDILVKSEILQLKDVFAEGADYITPISEAIKEQMQAQMDADENVYYWLDDEIEEWNFKSVTDETSFYINENGNVVIGFNEGDVAPMYMGAVEFEIPGDVLNDIRK